jgi:glucose/arabinose dehydrogenase
VDGVNERDEVGSDLVPDYMTSVKDGGFYGWPFSYYGQHVDTRVPYNPDMVAKAIVPDYAPGNHTASLGLTFDSGSSLPEPYHGGAFIGPHTCDASSGPTASPIFQSVGFRQGQVCYTKFTSIAA